MRVVLFPVIVLLLLLVSVFISTTQVIVPQQLQSNAQTATPTPYPGYVKNPNDTQLLVTVKLVGIGKDGNRTPKQLTRPIFLDIYDLSNNRVLRGSGFIKFDGNVFKGVIHLGTFKNGTYYIKIFGDRTLQTVVMPQFLKLRNDQLNLIPQVSLVQGDLTSDNVLDLRDYNVALACFQDKKCETKSIVDFNDDAVMNITDYNLLLQTFWQFRGD